MKLRKILATVAAAAVAVSAMAVSAFAATTVNVEGEHFTAENACWLFYTAGDEEEPGYSDVDLASVYGVKYNVTFDEAQMADEEAWIGGGVGFNSESTGWASTEWGKASGEKPIALTADVSQDIVLLKDAPVFADTDTFAQVWIQCWGGDMTVNSVTLLGADGAELATLPASTNNEESEGEEGEEVTEAGEEGEEGEEVTEAGEEAGEEAGAGDTTETEGNKGNSDTGVEGVAVVAGLAVVAAGAVIVAKKRG